MTICTYCERDMSNTPTCQPTIIPTADGDLQPTRYGSELHDRGASAGNQCGDCGVQPGGYHHPNCDLEECPRCLGQMLSCGCVVLRDEEL